MDEAFSKCDLPDAVDVGIEHNIILQIRNS
jgi:hypothetical protein